MIIRMLRVTTLIDLATRVQLRRTTHPREDEDHVTRSKRKIYIPDEFREHRSFVTLKYREIIIRGIRRDGRSQH